MCKNLIGAVALLSVGMVEAMPINITGVIINSEGNLFKNGVMYIDQVGGEARGIGKVNEIRGHDGGVLWADGDNGVELNYVFSGYNRASETNIGASLNAYGDTGGGVSFHINTLGTFSPTGNWDNDRMGITTGDLFLEAIGHNDADGYTVQGVESDFANSGNGLLSVLGGLAATYFDQNQLPFGADMSFNFSTDTIATAGYDYSGSADVAVLSNGVPIVGTAGLVLLGMVGMCKRN